MNAPSLKHLSVKKGKNKAKPPKKSEHKQELTLTPMVKKDYPPTVLTNPNPILLGRVIKNAKSPTGYSVDLIHYIFWGGDAGKVFDLLNIEFARQSAGFLLGQPYDFHTLPPNPLEVNTHTLSSENLACTFDRPETTYLEYNPYYKDRVYSTKEFTTVLNDGIGGQSFQCAFLLNSDTGVWFQLMGDGSKKKWRA